MEDTIMACNHDNSLSQEKRGRTLAVIMSCLLAGGASLAFGAEVSVATGAEGSAQLSQTSDGISGDSRVKADTRANAQAGVRFDEFESGARAESDTSARVSARRSQESNEQPSEPAGDRANRTVESASRPSLKIAGRAKASVESSGSAALESGQTVANTVGEQLEVTADKAVSVAEIGTARLVDAVDSIEVPETDAGLIASATGEVAATGDAQATDAVDAALESTLKGEIAGSINSTVQDDVRDSIQADLVTEITRSLPLPGRN
jgi:hypothetical protein